MQGGIAAYLRLLTVAGQRHANVANQAPVIRLSGVRLSALTN
jgi:hypothetical protein